jgi:hypothetical protein
MRIMTALLVLLCGGLALPASAQTTFADLRITGHPTLYVTELTGRETKGKLSSLRDEAITLQIKGATKTFAPSEVAMIERRGDSLKNGAVAGAVVAGICLLTCAQGVSSGGQLARVAFSNAMLPVVIDAAYIGRTRIWPIKKVSRIK